MISTTKIDEMVQELTLEEKVGMIHGNGLFRTEGVRRLGIPAFKMADGPMGVRNEFENDNWQALGLSDDYVTYLPSNSALAATWNRTLAYKTGQVLGKEARGRGKDMILAPGINIKRSPLCGRNFEYMSEDPYHIEELAVPLVKGIQESDVSACVKHFAANNQETERLWVEAIIDERALHEIYLPGFKATVEKGNTYGMMGAYNKIKGEHCCQSNFLLNDILRKAWKYDGIVVSDWGGVHDTRCAAESGLDIEMSVTNNFDEYFMAQPLIESVKRGEISEVLIDKKVKNILNIMNKLNMLEGERKSGCYNSVEHRVIALEGARESVVLLKNTEELLPLQPKTLKKVLVIGSNADRIHSNGGGSAEIKALYEISPLMGLKSQLGGNVEVVFAKGYDDGLGQKAQEVNWQESSLDEPTDEDSKVVAFKEQPKETLLEEAVRLAKEIDDVIIIGGLNHQYDTEGQDRIDLQLPYGQDELIEEILKVNSSAIVVMVAGSPVDMSKWIEQAKTVVWSWYAGLEGGNALAEVLLGKYNPSGKLPETFPRYLTDCSAHKVGEFPGEKEVNYAEGIFVGYRYFDSKDIEPLFCFGHGLSYTPFEYSVVKVEVEENKENAKATIKCAVTNKGMQEGAEVVQLYVRDIESTQERPQQELKGFEKVFLQSGETKKIQFILDESAFAYYDIELGKFKVEAGEFEIGIGSSSRDIRIKESIELEHSYIINR